MKGIKFTVIGLILCSLFSCEQSDSAKIKKIVQVYFNARSEDAVNRTDQARKYRSATFYNPGSENEIETLIIDNKLDIASIEQESVVVDSNSGTTGIAYQVEIVVKVPTFK